MSKAKQDYDKAMYVVQEVFRWGFYSLAAYGAINLGKKGVQKIRGDKDD
jgi:hypothetical protein